MKKREHFIIVYRNTSYCYNLAQKLDNSVQIVKRLVRYDGGKLSRVGELSLAERLQGS